jgi:hypothetical protein
MDTRLRAWAKTGEYRDEPEAVPQLGARAGRPRPTAAPFEGVMVAALVPVGIVVGALLAVAFLARLLVLPFQLAASPRAERRE